MNFSFRILYKNTTTSARVGVLKTSHGEIHTPAFIAVATQASVKSVTPEDLREVGIQVVIANSYHLHLRPGGEIIQRMGGLHRFMGWDGPLMTDSGGFQAFSMGAGREHGVGKVAPIFPDEDKEGPNRTPGGREPIPVVNPVDSELFNRVNISEQGIGFRSYLDGSEHLFTPESAIDLQRKLGADIILALDECTSPLHDYGYTKQAMKRTHQWAERALRRYKQVKVSRQQALFGIIQGGAYQDLRRQSAQFIGGLGFDGIAIGGSLGRSKKDMHEVLERTVPLLPEHLPRHLLGIGEIPDIFEAVQTGVDIFDCVLPTRTARTGTFLVKDSEKGRLNIINSKFKDDPKSISQDCDCYTCRNFSRAYLRHLFMAKELLAYRLATIHNLYFMTSLMSRIRKAIAEERFLELKREWLG